MTDVGKIIGDWIEEKKRQKTLTLASRFNFDHLREVNLDSDGDTINADIDQFLEWSSSMLRRVPINWKDFLSNAPPDLDVLFRETEELLLQISAAGKRPIAARASALSRLSSDAQSIMGKSLNSLKDFVFLQNIGADRSGIIEEVVERLRQADEKISAKLEAAEVNAAKLSEMTEASQEATAKIAASGRARIFHTDGKNFEKAAKIWLGVTAILGFLLAFIAFGFGFGWFLEINAGADTGQIASHIFAKALILATVGGAVTFSAKQFGANKHNAIQNLHRSSALRTYRALLSATRDEAVHEAILQQAAHAIFSPSETGYSKHGTPAEHAPMLQLFQDVTKKEPAE